MTQGFANNDNSVTSRLKTSEDICLGANVPTGLGSYRGTQEDELQFREVQYRLGLTVGLMWREEDSTKHLRPVAFGLNLVFMNTSLAKD